MKLSFNSSSSILKEVTKNQIRLGIYALAMLVGAISAFTTKHKFLSARTYGILGSTASGNYYIVTLFIVPDRCERSNETCCVLITDGGIEVTQIAVSEADVIEYDATYMKVH